MLKFLSKFFDEHSRTIKSYKAVVEQVNGLEKYYQDLTDAELKAKTSDFKDQLKSLLDQGKTDQQALDQILPDAFAAVREAASRSLNLRHYDVQLIAGLAFHNKMIAEQKTGE